MNGSSGKTVVRALCASILCLIWACGDDSVPPAAAGGSSGGGTAGMGAGGMGASPTAGCSAADATITGSAAHAAALNAIAGMASCGLSSSCHQGNGKAKLVLKTMTDLRMGMVNKMSCFVPTMPLVDGRGGQAALSNSWLWIKLTHPLNASGVLVPEAAWGTPAASCDTLETGSFGYRMPWIMSQEMYAPPSVLNAVRNWICSGAAGP